MVACCGERFVGVACVLAGDHRIHTGETTTSDGGRLVVIWQYTPPTLKLSEGVF